MAGVKWSLDSIVMHDYDQSTETPSCGLSTKGRALYISNISRIAMHLIKPGTPMLNHSAHSLFAN